MHNLGYPFAAIAGQEPAKRALILNLVNPRIGGVLLCGEKGTAKSTLVRGAAALSGKKVVDLPLNATEDMLIGSIDFEATVKEGKRKFAGGILERANGNILYVDEINLLSDSMASAVVSAAAAGENLVEREGISYRHECSFVLVGTMNPEEGGLRPQLLDKFGLYVGVSGERDIEQRVEIIRRRIQYEKSPVHFCEAYESDRRKLEKKISNARNLLPQVHADENVRRVAGKLAAAAFCEGNRAELLLIETACSIAALDERTYVTVADLKEAAEYVLPHRQRENPTIPPDKSEKNQSKSDEQEDFSKNESRNEDAENINDSLNDENDESIDAEYSSESSNEQENSGEANEELVEGEAIYQIIRLPGDIRDRLARKGTGRRRRTISGSNRGRYAGFSMDKGKGNDVALDATLRAAAPFQKEREKKNCAVAIEDCDIRYKKRESHVGATIVFVVDASGSMGASRRMKETKEAVLSMLMDSYQKRDKIGMIAFRQKKAEVLLEITSSVDLAEKQLQALPTGGRTPLADGLYRAWELLQARKHKDPEMLPFVVLITDGRANSPLWGDDPVEDALKAASMIANDHIPAIVVDTENDFLSFHLAERIASAMEADYFKVNELRSKQLTGIVSLNREQLMGN